MEQSNERRARSRIARTLATAAAALLCVAALNSPNPAYAEHGGGGGGHGGGFRDGGFRDGGFHRGGFRGGWGGTYYPGGYGYYPYDSYYGQGQYSSSGTWYYCADPAGYYPYVSQCYTDWQT